MPFVLRESVLAVSVLWRGTLLGRRDLRGQIGLAAFEIRETYSAVITRKFGGSGSQSAASRGKA